MINGCIIKEALCFKHLLGIKLTPDRKYIYDSLLEKRSASYTATEGVWIHLSCSNFKRHTSNGHCCYVCATDAHYYLSIIDRVQKHLHGLKYFLTTSIFSQTKCCKSSLSLFPWKKVLKRYIFQLLQVRFLQLKLAMPYTHADSFLIPFGKRNSIWTPFFSQEPLLCGKK